MVGQILSPTHHACGEVLIPPAERSNDEVIQTTHDTCNQQRLGLIATFRTADEHLRCCRCFGERILAMHLAYEILTERNQKQNADDTAQER